MGVFSKSNNIKIIKKSNISVQKNNVKDVVSAWDDLFDFPPLTPYNNSNSMFNIDTLKKEDGSFYTIDELSEVLRNYVGLDVLPFSFPNTLSFNFMRNELVKAKFNDSPQHPNAIDFLYDVFCIREFDYGNIDCRVIGAKLPNIGVSARRKPLRGNKEYIEQMIATGLLENKKIGGGTQYYLTPLAKSLDYLMRYYAGYTSANSPEFNKKINNIFNEMLTEKTYASSIYKTALNPTSFYIIDQSYNINLDTQKSIFILHGYHDRLSPEQSPEQSFEDSFKFFDILIARTRNGKKENNLYNQGINTSNKNNDPRRAQYVVSIPAYKQNSAYKKMVLDKINTVKNNNCILPLEPIALEEQNINYYSKAYSTTRTLIFRSSVPDSDEVHYHRMDLNELKKYLVANDLEYNDLELGVSLTTDKNSTGSRNPFEPTIVIKNKNNGELLGITNRITEPIRVGSLKYFLEDMYRTMNF